MSFPEKSRQWYFRVWGAGDANKSSCQKSFYSEKNGFSRNCQRGNLYVMEVKVDGGRGSVGIPICRHHFMELKGTNIYGPQSSLYPELAWALRDYPEDKDSFKKIEHSSDSHRTRAGDWSTDEYLFNLAKKRESDYLLNHPEDKKPSIKPKHSRTWVDIINDGFYGADSDISK